MEGKRGASEDAWRETALPLGRTVKERRRAAGLTQADLVSKLAAHGVAMHQTTVAKLEAGTRPTSVHELLGLARVLDCGVEDLLRPAQPDDSELQAAVRDVELAQVRVDRLAREKDAAEAALERAVVELKWAEERRDAVGLKYLVAVGEQARKPE